MIRLLVPALLVLTACTAGDMSDDRSKAPPAAGPAARPQAPLPPAPGAAPAPAPAPASATADGRAVYGRICQTCHQANGEGLAPAWPPLAGSEWVAGDADRVIKIVLHGLTGPITVKGQQFNSTMAAWKAVLSDAEIAAVITYVRSNFGNSASEVAAADVARVRSATSSQTGPYTAATLGR